MFINNSPYFGAGLKNNPRINPSFNPRKKPLFKPSFNMVCTVIRSGSLTLKSIALSNQSDF